MSSTSFGDLWNELTAQVKVLDALAAQKFINRAWSDVGKAYEWSWLRALGVFSAPAIISTGLVSINQFSRDLTFDATAAAILDALTLDIPLTTRQIKIAGGPPYSIASYTPGGTATLDPLGLVFQEASAVTATFVIVKAYYAPPSPDFARFISVRDPISGYRLAFGSQFTQEALDRYDPVRSDASQPRCIATLYSKLSDAGIDGGGPATGQITAFSPRWEIWPHPTTARGFQIAYRKRTVDFVNDDDTIPDSISPDLIITRAKYRAYEWAETNKAGQPDLLSTNWMALVGMALGEYKELLRAEIKADRETFPNSRVFRQQGYGRYDPTWIQTHEDPIASLEAFFNYRF